MSSSKDNGYSEPEKEYDDLVQEITLHFDPTADLKRIENINLTCNCITKNTKILQSKKKLTRLRSVLKEVEDETEKLKDEHDTNQMKHERNKKLVEISKVMFNSLANVQWMESNDTIKGSIILGQQVSNFEFPIKADEFEITKNLWGRFN